MLCVFIHYRSVSVFVYSTIVCRILFMSATLLDVCVLLLFAALYTYRLNYCALVLGAVHPKHPTGEGHDIYVQGAESLQVDGSRSHTPDPCRRLFQTLKRKGYAPFH